LIIGPTVLFQHPRRYPSNKEKLIRDKAISGPMAKKRIKTYIEGFDEYLNGGVPEGHIIMIAGTSGAMKTSVAWNILYHNALEENRKGLYMTFEQSAESIIEQMEGLGLPYKDVEGKVEIVDVATMRSAVPGGKIESLGTEETWSWTFVVEELIKRYKKQFGFELLVFDSINVYEMIAEVKAPRVELYNFFQLLKKMKITAFITSEMAPESSIYCQLGESFLADGIIHLKMDQVDRIREQRRIKCVKMRGTKHSSDYFTLFYEGKCFSTSSIIGK
jgi:circadian clock protein KaiC